MYGHSSKRRLEMESTTFHKVGYTGYTINSMLDLICSISNSCATDMQTGLKPRSSWKCLSRQIEEDPRTSPSVMLPCCHEHRVKY